MGVADRPSASGYVLVLEGVKFPIRVALRRAMEKVGRLCGAWGGAPPKK